MKSTRRWQQLLLNSLAIILGNALYSLAVALFLEPAGLITGGATGIALAFGRLTGLSVSGFLFLFNMSMLVWGWAVLGKKFALNTLASSVLSPAFLELFERLLDGRVLTEDIFLCTIFSGLGIGVALGMVIRAGASTGGMDIPPLVLQKWFRWPVSITMMLFDIAILLVQAAFSQPEQVLYGIVLVITHTIVMDKMLMLGDSRTEVKIISTRSDEIRTAILAEIDRGVTVLHGEGGYTGEPSEVLLQPGAAPAGKAGPFHRPRLFPHRQPRDRSQRPGLLDGKGIPVNLLDSVSAICYIDIRITKSILGFRTGTPLPFGVICTKARFITGKRSQL